jgi:hypothetical protein
VTDATGRVTETRRTDEYGVPTETTGAVGQPFGYTGEQRDTYPGGAGDPSSQHRYAHVANNPINATDPSGHDPAKKSKVLGMRQLF